MDLEVDSCQGLNRHARNRDGRVKPARGWLSRCLAPRSSWLVVTAFGLALGTASCGSDDTANQTGAGGSGTGSGGTVGSGGIREAGTDVSTGGNDGAARGGGGMAGSGGSSGAGGTATGGTRDSGGTDVEAGAPDADAAADVIICPDGGNPNLDFDFDGVPDCLDGCPMDQLKLAPGICGCGTSDTSNIDNDMTIDCMDGCPLDGTKQAPGVCGCGLSDTLDSDNDGIVDCIDPCPRSAGDAAAPGLCGCINIVGDPLCLAHRYSFNGAGTVAIDTGHATLANGTVVNTTLGTEAGPGAVALAGGVSDQYVALPPGIISALGNSGTFEVWVTFNPIDATPWQRIFDFGSSDNGPQQGNGVTYFFLSPRAGSGLVRSVLTTNGIPAETLIEGLAPAPSGVMTHFAVVIDGTTRSMTLYENGVPEPPGSTGVVLRQPGPNLTELAFINDAHNWLGRSQFSGDQEFAGTIHEFRIYSRALPPEQIRANAAAGPDTLAPVVDAGIPDASDAAADVSSQ